MGGVPFPWEASQFHTKGQQVLLVLLYHVREMTGVGTLRHRHEHSRKTLGDSLQQRKQVQLGLTSSWWYNTSLQETFNVWRLMHAGCWPRCKRPSETVASAVALALWEQWCGWQHILWLDNFTGGGPDLHSGLMMCP